MIYYMSVNVWDWRTEWYDEDDYQKTPKDNPKGSSRGKAGVLRSGSYYSNARETQASTRESVNLTYRAFVLGFLLGPSPQHFRDFFLFCFLSIRRRDLPGGGF
jgi:formylglycine-generating enzyme required for sulfatase activity